MTREDPWVIELEGVSAANDAGLPTLVDARLRVARGARVAILSHAGAGKSTLMAVLAGLAPATGGLARVLGRDLRALDYRSTRAHALAVALVHQSGGLLANRTVRHNIELPLAYHHGSRPLDGVPTPTELARALAIEDDLDERAAWVHPSIARRALFARAIARDPEILLVDEPMAALSDRDAALVEAVIEAWRARKNGTIVLAASEGELGPFVVDVRYWLDRGATLPTG